MMHAVAVKARCNIVGSPTNYPSHALFVFAPTPSNLPGRGARTGPGERRPSYVGQAAVQKGPEKKIALGSLCKFSQ